MNDILFRVASLEVEHNYYCLWLLRLERNWRDVTESMVTI